MHKIFYRRRINAKEVLIRQKDDSFMFSIADGTTKLSGRDLRIPSSYSKE